MRFAPRRRPGRLDGGRAHATACLYWSHSLCAGGGGLLALARTLDVMHWSALTRHACTACSVLRLSYNTCLLQEARRSAELALAVGGGHAPGAPAAQSVIAGRRRLVARRSCFVACCFGVGMPRAARRRRTNAPRACAARAAHCFAAVSAAQPAAHMHSGSFTRPQDSSLLFFTPSQLCGQPRTAAPHRAGRAGCGREGRARLQPARAASPPPRASHACCSYLLGACIGVAGVSL